MKIIIALPQIVGSSMGSRGPFRTRKMPSLEIIEREDDRHRDRDYEIIEPLSECLQE